jgi:hypothetical protein
LSQPSGPIFGPHLYEFAAEMEVLDWEPMATLLASMEPLAELDYYVPGSFSEVLIGGDQRASPRLSPEPLGRSSLEH